MLRVALSVVLLLTFASLIPSSIAALDNQLKEEIDAFIENILTCRDIVGMNLAVVYNGETLYTQVGCGDTCSDFSSTFLQIMKKSKEIDLCLDS